MMRFWRFSFNLGQGRTERDQKKKEKFSSAGHAGRALLLTAVNLGFAACSSAYCTLRSPDLSGVRENSSFYCVNGADGQEDRRTKPWRHRNRRCERPTHRKSERVRARDTERAENLKRRSRCSVENKLFGVAAGKTSSLFFARRTLTHDKLYSKCARLRLLKLRGPAKGTSQQACSRASLTSRDFPGRPSSL